jgi:hypothetical protein
MGAALTAQDLWPLVLELPPAERMLLAKLARRSAVQEGAGDRAAHEAAPPPADELGSEGDPLAWEADGWDEVDASR